MEAIATSDLEFPGTPFSANTALASLPKPVREWFAGRFGDPTPAQRLAWPAIRTGKNLLLCSPTGSGKTLAAFLPILGRLLEEPGGPGVRCLYITPLKALGNDTRKTLRLCLRAAQQAGPAACRPVRVQLRTGDTSARLRRRLWQRPPDILLTTPETLAVLLTQPAAADLFRALDWVVVDEVHALAPNKRGADLALSLERLSALRALHACAGAPGDSFQRIGLSATCARPEEAARFLVGTTRPCWVAQVAESAPLDLIVEPLFADPRAIAGEPREPQPRVDSFNQSRGFMARLVERLELEIRGNRTTLIFTNVRGLAERLAWALRRQFPEWSEQIAVHHSALAAARRRAVERRLKQGRLRAVVSSTSLELGIDIGSVDGVVLVHPPGGVVRLLQRVGRGGHEPGRPRRGLVLTSSASELLEATVTAAAGRSSQCEPFAVPAHPLDVLCQHLLGLATQGWWEPGNAFDLVRRAYPYRDLSRQDFDDCLDYLSGRHPDGREWLPPRLRREDRRFAILDRRTTRLLQRNIGTIVADEPRPVRLVGERPTDVGQVDDAFADRLQPGDRFLLDGRCLEYRRPEGPALLVEETVGRPAVPRWGGDGRPLSAELAERLYILRMRAAEALREGPAELVDLLARDYGLTSEPAAELVVFFRHQDCVSEIPEPGTCLVEIVANGFGHDYYVHTPLNRAANDALARVAVRRLVRVHGRSATSVVADLGFALNVSGPTALTDRALRELLAVEGFEADLAGAVAGSHTLRERFRQVALTGLMLLRNPLGLRRRVGGQDWPERRLFDQVSLAVPDFVLLRQARREVAEQCCDAGPARSFLEHVERWQVRCRRLAAPSPFAESWTQAAAGAAESAETPTDVLQRLHAQLTGT